MTEGAPRPRPLRPANQRRIPPHSSDSEAAVLGAAMLWADSLDVVVHNLDPEDFYVPIHARICEALHEMWDQGNMKVDSLMVTNHMDRANTFGPDFGPTYLVTLVANAVSPSVVQQHVRMIADYATLRRVLAFSLELVEGIYNGASLADVLADYRARLDDLTYLVLTEEVSVDGTEFSVEDDDGPRWVVPGLIEHQDRIIITGAEGIGKSVLSRQLAVQLAAGVHPFRFYPIDPCNVLLIDLENSVRQVRRGLRGLLDMAGDRLTPGRLRLEVKSEGIDLMSAHDARWLIGRVAVNHPDILFIGPQYKLHNSDPNDEGPAKQVTRLLDLIRRKYNCAIVMEAHSPHGEGRRRDLRPFGASLWRRWPEFGYGMAETDDVTAKWWQPWRGDRDTREWPSKIIHGGAGEWPWKDAYYRAPHLDERF